MSGSRVNDTARRPAASNRGSLDRCWGILTALALAAGLTGVGCVDERELETPRVGDVASPFCYDCHGDPTNGNPAPPPVIWQSDSAASAHQAHLKAAAWHGPMPCDACHRVPTQTLDPGHVDTPRPAEVTFSGLATEDGAEASYDGATKGCQGTYCHGGAFEGGGGSLTDPVWTVLDGSQAQCGTCHGLPPDPPHAQRDDCASCHGQVIAEDGSFLRPDLHVDGQVELGRLACDSCHGGDGQPAPPVDTEGNSATTAPGVGAHRPHLDAANWHAQIRCAECHTVPTSVDDPGHIDDGPPAELTWGELATADGADPIYDVEDTTCSGVYCHGATFGAGQGTVPTPVWTEVDGTQAECGACHGIPPGGGHVGRTDCETCHEDVVSGLTIIAPGLHVDGQVEVVALTCSTCHGSDGDPAPPVDTLGNTQTSAPGVGAHRRHLGASDWHAEVACDECHEVPTAVDSPGHIVDGLPAQLAFGDLASTGGADPDYDFDSLTCSGVYCHGATLGDAAGSATEPIWTVVDGSQEACDSCHGAPPGGLHPDRSDCSQCHSAVIGADGTFVDASLHINGEVDVDELNCESCHGQDGQPAPPPDTHGNFRRTEPGVGAHGPHVGASSWHRQVECSECHTVPSAINATGHIDTPLPAEVIFTGVAVEDDADPDYSYDTTTCTGVYCHGATIVSGGGSVTAPVWTDADAAGVCGACHGLPPGGFHPDPNPAPDTCSCHSNVISGRFNIIAPELHINGSVDFSD